MSSNDPNPHNQFVNLYSSDGHRFVLDEWIAMECETFKKMLKFENQGGDTKELKLDIKAKLLEKVIEYLYYKYKYTDSRETIPDFPIDDDCVLDLLMVANYLNLQ